ncbi:MAG: hypothetical protein OXK21_10990 [Chloroflexota bacterium]|nr:hypothetical protein [Chloroflexota bacterium]
MPETDRAEFLAQARREGMSFSAWIRAAARQRLDENRKTLAYPTEEELERFFAECAASSGPGPELDWEEYKRIINEEPLRGLIEP